MTQGRSGQPKIKDWERIRVKAWTELVRRETQAKMDKYLLGSLDKKSAFYPVAQILAERWRVPQRKSQFPNTVTMTDLGAIFLGTRDTDQTRTDFSSYCNGVNARPKKSLLENIEKSLPGTLRYFQIGPFDLPLWAALEGQNCEDTFWSQLLSSKFFGAVQWRHQTNLINSLSPSIVTKKTLLEISWDQWADRLVKHLEPNNQSDSELVGLAVLAVSVLTQASRSSKLGDLREKEKLLAILPKFSKIWSLFDVAYPLDIRHSRPSITPSFVEGHLKGLEITIAGHIELAKEQGFI